MKNAWWLHYYYSNLFIKIYNPFLWKKIVIHYTDLYNQIETTKYNYRF